LKTLDKLRTLLHWQPQPKPHIDLNYQIYGLLKPFRLPAILVVLTMMFGAIGYMIIDDFTLMDAIYQTGITFTTVGFGEIAPISYQGQVFTVTLIIIGFLIFTISIGIVAEALKNGQIFRLIKERNMLYKIARLKKHFVICYHNEFTAQVAKQLRQSHVPFVVVDPREDMDDIAHRYNYPYFVNENPHTNEAMLKSFLSSAKGLITLSDNIADNIATIASARLYEKEIGKEYPYHIIAKANNTQDEDKILKLGADKAVIPTKLMAQRVSSIAIRPDMVNLIEKFMYSQDSALDMEEVFVPKKSWLVLRKLKESRFRDVTNVSVVGIRKKDGVFISMPKGDELVTSECKLLLIGKAEGIQLTKQLINKTQKPKELSYV
jgi:voltage-gated potassium channel